MTEDKIAILESKIEQLESELEFACIISKKRSEEILQLEAGKAELSKMLDDAMGLLMNFNQCEDEQWLQERSELISKYMEE